MRTASAKGHDVQRDGGLGDDPGLVLALGYRTRGRDAATFQIVLSGIRTTPERLPHNAFGVGFGGLALARRRRGGRRR